MKRSRRDVIRLGGASVATALAGGLAGCSGIDETLSGGTDTTSGPSNPLAMVPSGVSAVARGDVTATLNDSAITKFVNAVLDLFAKQEGYSGPTNKRELLDRFAQEAGIELSGAKTAVGYLKYPGPGTETPAGGQYSGLWFEADWSTDAVVSALETATYTFTESSYAGHTVYRPDEEFQTLWLAVTGSNSYVLGTEPAIKDAVDVAEGSMDGVGGDLVSAYEGVRSAPFKFATSVPEERIPSGSQQIGQSSIDLQQLASVNHVAGVTYHDGDTVGIRVELLTGGSSDAEDVRNMLAGAASAGEGQIGNETLRKALDDVSVTQDGSTVVVEVSGSVDRATRVIEAIVRQVYLGARAGSTEEVQ